MAIKINLAKAERIVIPPGFYPCLVDKVEYRPRGGSGNTGPTMHIEAITQDATDEEQNGVRLYRDQSLMEQSLWSALEFVRACLGEVAGDEDGDFEFEPEDLEGTVAIARVSIDNSFDGRDRNRIDAWYHVDAEIPDLMDGEKEGEEASEEEEVAAD